MQKLFDFGKLCSAFSVAALASFVVIDANAALPAHCASGTGDTCSECDSGYTLSNGACVVSGIKIATTRVVDEEFTPIEARLADVRETIADLITQMQANTDDVGDLQVDKQTRPDSSCPEGRKCLLVKDIYGQENWYVIIESAP